ncbi:uncharacterized protein LOC128671849 isoform X2 [Plodia interpunctella]|uniref:uncharacterized protein LOC128671849 isoform X2 n=1 Tax=Plodia interpunctella TaxID=58824 RepID=UPI002368529F|nr:uncharacterized protein LOC128671849 isoform X2 [Plodia interpunctella]
MFRKRSIISQFNSYLIYDLIAFREFEPFAASPPEDIFYIRYPKTDILFGKPKIEQDFSKPLITESKEVTAAPSYNAVKERDWSKHTKPCQDVLHGIAPINTAVNSISAKPKPAGVDDGFKGEGAACGTSVVKVAHQMITKGASSRGFTIATPDEDADGPPRLSSRRGSKSLPASPSHSPRGSPTSRRKMTANRYFTSPFEPSPDGSGRSWLTMALLGFKKDHNASTSTLAEEDALEVRLHGSLAESVERLGPAPRKEPLVPPAPPAPPAAAPEPRPVKAAHSLRPKPSELREMNFWSPTSM